MISSKRPFDVIITFLPYGVCAGCICSDAHKIDNYFRLQGIFLRWVLMHFIKYIDVA